MKVIVAGSRNIDNIEKSFKLIKDGLAELGNLPFETNKIEIVSGGARGIDTIAEDFSKVYNIKFKRFPAFWEKHGKRAGFYRNCAMADYVGEDGALIAIWDGHSRGTKMMIDIAKKKGMRVFVYEIN